MISKEDLFSEHTPGKFIKGFPYPERFCTYCKEPLKLLKTIHIVDEPEHYKAIMICLNKDCGSYDEEAREAYVRVYYSSQYAYKRLELYLVKDPRSPRK